jgi:hypothetical protein
MPAAQRTVLQGSVGGSGSIGGSVFGCPPLSWPPAGTLAEPLEPPLGAEPPLAEPLEPPLGNEPPLGDEPPLAEPLEPPLGNEPPVGEPPPEAAEPPDPGSGSDIGMTDWSGPSGSNSASLGEQPATMPKVSKESAQTRKLVMLVNWGEG